MIIFNCLQGKVLKAMQIAASVSDTNQQSILQSTTLVKTGKLLRVTGVCPEMEISSTSDLGGNNCKFATAFPVRKVISILQSMPADEPVLLENSGNFLILKGRTAHVVLNTWTAESFPAAKFEGTTTAVFSVPQRVLAELIEQVAFAMPKANHHPHLNGVCLRIRKDTLTLIASDLTTVAMAVSPSQTNHSYAEAILPYRSVSELQRWLNRSNDLVSVHLTTNQARFSFGGLEIITRLQAGCFPDFTSVTSKRPSTAINVPRAALMSSLQRAFTFSKTGLNAVQLTLKDNILKVSSVLNESGFSTDEIVVQYIGETIQSSFNTKFLLDAVSNTKSDILTLALGNNKDFLHMTKADDNGFLYVAAQFRI